MNMWRGYDYLDIPFTKDEILQSINNIKKDGESLLSDISTNASHDQLMSSILDYDYRQSKKDNNIQDNINRNIKLFTSLLNELKNDPINYLGLIHSHSIHKLFDNTSQNLYQSRDLGVSDMYNKYIDFNVIIESIEKAHNDMKEHFNEYKSYDKDLFKNKNGYYIEAYLKQLSHFIAFSYDNPTFSYDNPKDKYLSLLDDKKTEQLIDSLNKNLPLFIFELSQIGGLGNIKHVISNNFDKYYYPELVDNLFIHSFTKEMTKNLNFSYESIDKNWQSKDAIVYFNNLVTYLINNKKYEDLYKMNFVISQNEFHDQQIVSKIGMYEFFDSATSFIKEMPQFKNHKMSKLIDMMKLNDLAPENTNVKIKPKKI